MTEWLEERQRVLQAAQQLLAKRLTVGSSGNVSQRLGAELLAITPNRRYPEEPATAGITVTNTN